MKYMCAILISIFLIFSSSVTADIGDILEFTDPNCCVLKDIQLSNEMEVASGPFANGQNFSQIGASNPLYVGEFRGTYGNNWRPKQSSFGKTRGTKYHGGIDIYAPSNLLPLLPTIIAPVGGEFVLKPDDGGKLGNRVWIKFMFQGQPYRLILGHLKRFEGSNRTVKAGDIIGYAGCSGNADENGDCVTPNICGLTSGHVHIKLVNDATNKVYNPIKALRWKLDYADDPNADPCTVL